MEKLFLLSQEKNPELGDYLHLCKAVRSSGASRQEITILFEKFIPKEDFLKSEKIELIEYLKVQADI